MLPHVVCCRVSGAIHPGVIQKAERFVAAAQLKLASSLPKEVMGRLRVVVHTHTDVEVSRGSKVASPLSSGQHYACINHCPSRLLVVQVLRNTFSI